MNPLAFLTSGANSLIAILVTSILSLLGGAYLGYSYQTNYYEAKISKDNLKQKEAYEKDLAEKQAKKDLAIGELFKALQFEQAKNSGYQAQARDLFAMAHGSSSNCSVTFGFIRLFNASATGQPTEPTSSDSATSAIDLATVLQTVIENNGKYRDAANQIEAIRTATQ